MKIIISFLVFMWRRLPIWANIFGFQVQISKSDCLQFIFNMELIRCHFKFSPPFFFVKNIGPQYSKFLELWAKDILYKIILSKILFYGMIFLNHLDVVMITILIIPSLIIVAYIQSELQRSLLKIRDEGIMWAVTQPDKGR